MAATDLTVKNGEYFGPCGIAEMTGYPTRAEIVGKATEEKFTDESWKWSEEWTGFKYNL